MRRSAGEEESKTMSKETPNPPKTKKHVYKVIRQQLQQELEEVYSMQVIQN
jgi:hypothetical protein